MNISQVKKLAWGGLIMDIGRKVIGISLGLLLAAVMLPLALNQLANASMPKVNSSVVLILVVVLPILAIIGIALAFYEHGE
jgi:hypothetical protein